MYTDNYSDTPRIKCFMCNIGRHNCHNSKSEKDKAGWCWICVECRDLLIDDNVISAFKEDLSKKAEEKRESITKKRKRISMDTLVTQPMKKDNNKKDNNKRSNCKECNGIIYSFCVGCTICPDTWFHLPCAGIESKKEARKIGKTFKCKQCRSNKIKPKTKNSVVKTNVELWQQRLDEMEGDYTKIKPDCWLNDNHITYMLEDIQQDVGDDSKFLFIKPSVVHWLSNSNKEDIQNALDSEEVGWKELILMPV